MSLQLWMPLTKDLRQQGVSGITPTQTTGYTSVAAGKLGGCYKFTGTFDTLLPLSNWNWTENSVSFGCWAKISQSELTTLVNAATYDATYNSMGGTLLGRDSYGGIGLRWKTNNIYSTSALSAVYIYVHMRNTSSSSNNTSQYTIPFDTWFHVMTVIDRTENKIKVYINGELFTSTNLTVTGTFTTGTFRIAEATWDGGNGRPSVGCWQLNDVRVYDHALSQMEVKELAKGLVLHYPLNRQGWGQENLISNSQLNGSWTYPSSSYSDKYSPTTLIVPSGSVYTLSFDAKSTVNGDKVRTHYYNPNTTTTCTSSQGIVKTATDGNMDFTLTTSWKRYWVVYNQSETTAVKHIICPRLVSGNGTGTVSVKNVKFEEGSTATPWCPNSSDTLATTMGLNSTTEYDCSGLCNNGTRTGTFSWTSDTPKYQVSTSAQGSSGAKIIGPGMPAEAKSAAIWVKCAKTVNSVFFADKNSTLECGLLNSLIYANTTNSAGFTTTHWKDNQWNHVVVVNDNGTRRVYVNGESETASGANNYYMHTTDAVYLWTRSDNNSYPFNGQMSDFRIYATALSADDVKSLYQNSAYIDSSGNVYGAVHSEV